MDKAFAVTYGTGDFPAGTTETGMRVDVIAADGSVAASSPVFAAGTDTVTVTGIPDGTFTAQVQALDGAGAPLGAAVPLADGPFTVANDVTLPIPVGLRLA